MNWIRKIFLKREEQAVGLDQLSTLLDEKYENIAKNVEKRAVSLYSDIKNILKEIKTSVALLEHAKPEGTFHLKAVKIATSNRDNMVKQVRMLLENITVPEVTDFKTIINFYNNAMHSLSVCLDNMMKSQHYAKMVFLEESKQVIVKLNEFRRLLDQFKINEEIKLLNAFEDTRNVIKDIKDMSYDIEKEKKSIKELQEHIVVLNKNIEEYKISLTQLKESHAWKQYLHYKNELAQLEERLRETEYSINALVLPLSKGLNRLRQLVESERYVLSPEIKKGLYVCISDPKTVNPEFFIEFRDIVERNILNLSPAKQDKMLEQLELVISCIESYKKQYQALKKEIELKKNEISELGIHDEEKKLVSNIAELQDEVIATQRQLEASEKHLLSLEKDIVSKKQRLQQMVYQIDSKIRISF